MESELLFATIATVAITLAGFSGIAIAVVADSKPLTVRQRERFEVLILTALFAMVFALLPMCLHALGVSELWRLSSGALLVVLTPALALWVQQARRARRRHPESFSDLTFAYLLGIELTNVAMQALVVAGILDGPGIYAGGLLALLLHGAAQFRRMMFEPANYGP